ncbi:MAG: hypothetical protein AAGB93_11225 [Planctomycetota bacterium]
MAREFRVYEARFTVTTRVDTTTTDVRGRIGGDGRSARLLSAFFGLDNALPGTASRGIADGAGGMDGLPVVFSHEVDFGTLQVGDLRLTTASGAVSPILALTLAPATDVGELRTVLLVGELGSVEDPPARVEVVGDLLTIDGRANFRGTSVDVTPLEAGPTLVWAEGLPRSRWRVGEEGTVLPWEGGSGAPEGTTQVIGVTWAGGVTRPGGAEIGDETRGLYRVTLRTAEGSNLEVTPFAVADLGDGDNNHMLCLDREGTPVSVSLPAGVVTDPREDPNPVTRVEVWMAGANLLEAR